jgi:acyl-CoA thioester hydrolase
MISHQTAIRVAYPDTDRMGLVHHSAYVKYCETARWETFRAIGIPYSNIEEHGILMPVISMSFEFKKPAFYDDMLTVKTSIHKHPKACIHFLYEMFRQNGEQINSAETTLVFVNKHTFAPCFPPDFILHKLRPFFQENKIIEKQI